MLCLQGISPNTEKLGYNGFRHNALTGRVEQCEIKPKNVRSNSAAKNKPKLNGGGNFTDYSWAKFKRHREESPNMIVAGFIDGRLIHIFEFSFNEPNFTAQLHKQLKRRFPNGDRTGEYLRSAQFSYSHFKNADSLKLIYVAPKHQLTALREHFTKAVFNHLWRLAQC